MRILNLMVVGGLLLASTPTTTFAKDRALLIGVGKYKNPAHDLPGIGNDLDLMRETALRLGFEENAILVLRDQKATVAGVESAIRSHLGRAGRSDRILIYYSGHGTGDQDVSGDEDDGQDEALVLHEYSADGAGLLIDDRIAELLRSMKAKQILFFVDACHSGTVYKGFGGSNGNPFGPEVEGFVKGFGRGSNSGLVSSNSTKKKNTRDFVLEEDPGEAAPSSGGGDTIPRLVAFTAALDHQSAIATEEGSLFTLALHATVRDAAASGTTSRLGYQELQRSIATWVAGRGFDFQPSVYVDEAAPPSGISLLARAPGSRGPGWTQLEQTTRGIPKLKVGSAHSEYYMGEYLQLEIDVTEPGYLNVVAVGAKSDTTVVLFPNNRAPDNAVRRGKVTLGPKTGLFAKAAPPASDNLIVVFWTREQVDLQSSSLGIRDKAGRLKRGNYNETTVTRDFVLEEEDATPAVDVRVGKLVMPIREGQRPASSAASSSSKGRARRRRP